MQNTPCDLVTGEERRYGHLDGTPASHVACTVEMTSLTNRCKTRIDSNLKKKK